MNKQDMRAIRLQASIIRGQIECLTSAAKHSPLEMERIMSSVRVLESVARVIDAFVPEVMDKRPGRNQGVYVNGAYSVDVAQ